MSNNIFCPGPITRRGLIKSSFSAYLGYVLARNFIPSAWAADKTAANAIVSEYVAAKGQAKNVILMWMSGGPSHLDTFDPKPGTAQSGGIKAIEAANGLQISERFPNLAKQGKHLNVIRGLHSKEGDHGQASHLMHTGYREQSGVAFPGIGSIVCAEAKDGPKSELPSYVALNGGGWSSGLYGANYAPFSVPAGNAIPDLYPSSKIGPKVLKDRRKLLDNLDGYYASRTGASLALEHKEVYDRAIRLSNSPLAKLFQIGNEDKELASYGTSGFAKACLVAKRLVTKGGVKFVEIDQGGWDNHTEINTAIGKNCDTIDKPMARLIEELAAEGALQSTLIIWMGEFGRTPDINKTAGRDHYPRSFSACIAGGGVKGGKATGTSNATGHEPVDGISVPDMFCSICDACGIDATKVRESADGRPIQVVDKGAKTVPGIFG